MWSQKQEIIQDLRAECRDVLCCDWRGAATLPHRLYRYGSTALPFQRVGKQDGPSGAQMSWSPVATANFTVESILNHIPSPPPESTLWNPTEPAGAQLGTRSTDVPSPSCPLSRTSSQHLESTTAALELWLQRTTLAIFTPVTTSRLVSSIAGSSFVPGCLFCFRRNIVTHPRFYPHSK